MKDRLRETTRLAILEAAEEVFARDGVERARVDAIASVAGVSVGSIYNHIGDRDALFAAVRDLRRGEIIAVIDAALDETEGEGAAASLEALARVLLEHVERHRGFFAIVMETADRGRGGPPSETVSALTARVKAILRRGVREGSLRSDASRTHEVLFLGMLKAAIRARLVDATGPTPATWARSLTHVFVEGAGTRKASR